MAATLPGLATCSSRLGAAARLALDRPVARERRTGRLLPRSRFGGRTEPGAHQALLDVHRICWCAGSAPVELSEL